MRLIITDENTPDYDDGQLDTRKVSPADVGDALAGLIDDHMVEDCVLITANAEGEMLMLTTDMTNTEMVGFLNLAIMNYIHSFQHDED